MISVELRRDRQAAKTSTCNSWPATEGQAHLKDKEEAALSRVRTHRIWADGRVKKEVFGGSLQEVPSRTPQKESKMSLWETLRVKKNRLFF